MKARQALAVLVALAAAVTLTSVAAAGPDAAKQRVAITVKGRGVAGDARGTFTLAGTASDSGTSHVIGNTVIAHAVLGQRVFKGRSHGPGELDGKKGHLSFWWSGSFVAVNASTWVTTGTWRLRGNSGIYKTWTGGGTFVSVDRHTPSPDNHTPSGVGSYEARFDGLVTR
jgi:hypothetical protein